MGKTVWRQLWKPNTKTIKTVSNILIIRGYELLRWIKCLQLLRDLKDSKAAKNVEESLFYNAINSMTKFRRCAHKGTPQSVRKPSQKINKWASSKGHPELRQNIPGRWAWKGTLGTQVAVWLGWGMGLMGSRLHGYS